MGYLCCYFVGTDCEGDGGQEQEIVMGNEHIAPAYFQNWVSS